ncbi:MAG: long-chain-fatty-acid--CoA ligase [Ramlibacter sp.]|nr:long-chain-fatty-acid--CoA ligase [Ramlibacter sp.]
MQNFYETIRTLADIPDLHASGTALIFQGRCTSYPDLSAAANRIANAMAAQGLTPGGRVAFLGLDSDKSYEILFGCARAGMVFVPVNWKLNADEMEFIVRDAECELLFVTPETAQAAQDFRPRCPRLRAVVIVGGTAPGFAGYTDWRDAEPSSKPDRAVDPGAPVVQVYTSGTSGQPKGVVLAHSGFIDTVREIVRAGDEFIEWTAGDVTLLALPTFHVGGLWWAVQGLINGAANVVMKTFNSAEALVAIAELKITKLAFVPSMLRFLLSDPASATTDLSSVGLIIYGGSPMAIPLLENAQALFRCRFAQNYGMSETTNMAIFMPPSEHAAMTGQRRNAAGRPLRGVRIRIVDSAARDLPPGESGEIFFHTPTRMLEYWKRPEATAETLIDGWIRTGDAGHIDADGYLYITDRIKDLVISAGENIYPAELERALLTHPGVEEVAVIGIPDRRWGEVPIAYVVPVPGSGLTKADILAHARSHIASFKMIYDAILIDRLPRNSTGKVLKRVLREPHWAAQDRQVN